jgi:hypothetical protein
MKLALYAGLGLVAVLLFAGVAIYALGARLPVNHSTTVSGTVEASPAKVFAIITDIAHGPAWRKQVQSVQVLAPEGPEGNEDHWVEDLGHGQKMDFLAVRTEPPNAAQHALRVVELVDPKAQYGGTWTYQIASGPAPGQTLLQITEDGFINPPIYRFVMHHVLGMTANLDQYMRDIQAAAKST